MYIVTVTPLKKGIAIESLTYFSKIAYPYGTFLTIPIRGRDVCGIVSQCEEASATKTALRSATFSLRKLPEQTEPATVPASVLETAAELAKYYPAQPGAILFDLLPPDVRDGTHPYPTQHTCVSNEDPAPALLQGTWIERVTYYRSYIRTAFAHRGSVVLLVPSAADIGPTVAAIKAGIEDRIVTFGGHQTKRERAEAFTQLNDVSRVKLIVTTPGYLMLERCDITHIVVEQAGSPFYKRKHRPYLDWREVAKTYARVSGRAILLGDILPTSEDECSRREEKYQTIEEHPKRLTFPGTCEVITQTIDPIAKAPFTLLSSEVQHAVSYTTESRRNVFLLNARKGLASLVTCVDCGYIFRCPDSGTPYSLFESNNGGETRRWLLSRTSGRKVPAPDTCPDCGGWRLKEYGIGIQQVQQTLTALFPDLSIILFDHTTATTHKRALSISKRFYESKGAILLGTPMALPYLTSPIALTAVISFDALRATPSWRADESTLRTLLTLRDKTENSCLIQTRSEDEPLLQQVTRGTTEDFYTEELTLRSALSYPPASTLIVLTWQGNQTQVDTITTKIKPLLIQHQPQLYTDPMSTKAKTVQRALIRTKSWPDAQLADTLRTLPPYVRIEVNPDRIV